MESTTQALLISLFIVSVLAAGLYAAYEQGYLDPIIEKVGVYMFKAKAAAEKKKLQAQGMKAGEDFLDSELKGNKEAAAVSEGFGIGGLKKDL